MGWYFGGSSDRHWAYPEIYVVPAAQEKAKGWKTGLFRDPIGAGAAGQAF
jgi:hypothetical protein